MKAISTMAEPGGRILIVDDDDGIRSLIASFLDRNGCATDTAANPFEMRVKLAAARYDLIVLDLMMPGEDGLTALRRLQTVQDAPPVIMLSAVGTDIDRIVGLEIGAEDYLAKPCNPRELLARIRTVLRGDRGRAKRSSSLVADEETGELVHFAGWRLDLTARSARDPHGADVYLTDGEFRLLRAFVEHPRRVLSRDQLLDHARGADSEFFDRAIDVQVSRLRRKLGSPQFIRTVRNEGYMFVPPR